MCEGATIGTMLLGPQVFSVQFIADGPEPDISTYFTSANAERAACSNRLMLFNKRNGG